MPIEMPRGLPFSVDTWTPQSDRKRHHFLTHAHRDHLSSFASHSLYPIYATMLTRSMALRCFPQVEESVFVEIEVGVSLAVKDPDGDFNVTAFDANHCPGAVMFLFEGEFGNILHTGDCRLTPDCLQQLPMKYLTKKGRDNLCHLDYLFLDCTFGKCSLKIPSKQSAIQQVINCIWKHPNAPVVYLACDMLGQEEILVEVSRTFGTKIYVDKTNNSECFHTLSLVAPEILSQDDACRFQVIEGFPRLNERATQKLTEAHASLQPGPLFVRPSTQWYANNDQLEMTNMDKLILSEAMRDEFGIWHVCYSMHSTREELEWALQLLQPKWVISTTPPCRAMDLDYVKKHCFKTHITTDDPLWKLLRVSSGKSASLSTCIVSEAKNVIVSSFVKASEVEEVSMKMKLDLPELSSTRSFTLFGRARMGISDTELAQEKKSESFNVENEARMGISDMELVHEKKPESFDVENEIKASSQEKKSESFDVGNEIKETSLQENSIISHVESCSEKLVEETASFQTLQNVKSSVDNAEPIDKEKVELCSGSSRSVHDGLKKLYRSMNVPVPRPLPSLVELMGANKRVRIGSKSTASRLSHGFSSHYFSS